MGVLTQTQLDSRYLCESDSSDFHAMGYTDF